MRTLIRFLCAALLASAAACVRIHDPAGYRLNPESGTGLAVFSLSGNDWSGHFSFSYRDVGGSTGRKGTVPLAELWHPFDWQSPDSRLVVLELPAGSYEFHDWAGTYGKSVREFSIPFRVAPGKVTYLGSVHVDVHVEEKRFEVRLGDQAERDLAKLFERYPRLDRGAVEMALARFAPRRPPTRE